MTQAETERAVKAVRAEGREQAAALLELWAEGYEGKSDKMQNATDGIDYTVAITSLNLQAAMCFAGANAIRAMTDPAP